MATWAFYQEAALSNAYTALSLTASSAVFHCFLGSTTTGRKLVSTTTGGNLSISVADSATGGHATTAVKLSTTTGGIAGATPGAALTVGASIVGGTSGAFEFYASVTDAVGDGVFSNELTLALSAAKEQAVT